VLRVFLLAMHIPKFPKMYKIILSCFRLVFADAMITPILIGLIGGVICLKKWTMMMKQRDQDGGVKTDRIPMGVTRKSYEA